MLFKLISDIIAHKWFKTYLIAAICLVLVFLMLLWRIVSEDFKISRSYMNNSGLVNERTIKEAELLMGTDFPEKPTKLFYYCSEPNKDGGYRGFLRAEIPYEDFSKIIDELGMIEESLWPEHSHFAGTSHWWTPAWGPDKLTLKWFNVADDKKSITYAANTNGLGSFFMKYENGSMYFDVTELEQHRFFDFRIVD